MCVCDVMCNSMCVRETMCVNVCDCVCVLMCVTVCVECGVFSLRSMSNFIIIWNFNFLLFGVELREIEIVIQFQIHIFCSTEQSDLN